MEEVRGETLKKILRESEGDDGRIQEIGFMVGETIGRLHEGELIHGDLTTSNMMLGEGGEIVLIDFGLGSVSGGVEDRAVDLLVLERTVQSSHPTLDSILLPKVWEGYLSVGGEWGGEVMGRLEAARIRGRKRECFG